MRILRSLSLALAALLAPAATACGAPVTEHPRLLITPDDVSRLRSWARPDNPLWAQGLAMQAESLRKDFDDGTIPAGDKGTTKGESLPSEEYAELYAFMSLVDPDGNARAQWGTRARDTLMFAIEKALPGVGADDDVPFRGPNFAVDDRSRYWGEGWSLALDWAYPFFSKEDKEKIRTVFLRWIGEQYKGYPLEFIDTPPTLTRPFQDPALIADVRARRWSQNNYFAAHARNLVLMGLVLDEGDDPAGEVHKAFEQAVSQWLFVADHVMRNDAAGGLGSEGFEYSPQTLAYYAQALLAIATSGNDDVAVHGQQVSMRTNPFWRDVVPALLHSLPHRPVNVKGFDKNPTWQPASYGDNGNYEVAPVTALVAPIGLYAARVGDQTTLEAVRWTDRNVRPGGQGEFMSAVAGGPNAFDSILDFMLFDPGAGAAADPRPSIPLTHRATGPQRTFARTCWCSQARQFLHTLAWNTIDHQSLNGNDVGFARRGEWLTRERVGYSATSNLSDYANTVTIQNDKPSHDDDNRLQTWRRGSQWYQTGGDPKPIANSSGRGYVAVTGDATGLYNSSHEGVLDVRHASRSVVWLKPDHIVVYDRAITRKRKRRKRFWLQLPAAPRISGHTATVATPRRQRLYVTNLLPARARLSAPRDPEPGSRANYETMAHRLMAEDPKHPRAVRFLHVLQGANRTGKRSPAVAVKSRAGTPYAGAVVAGTAVLFPARLGAAFKRLEIPLRGGARRALVTGLTPGGTYGASVVRSTLHVAPGDDLRADGGGVLVVPLR